MPERTDLTDYRPLFYCEGSAERVIVETLLEAHMLIFEPKDAVWDTIADRPTIQRGKRKNLISQYLQLDYEKPVAILRILDSRNEKFSLPPAYSHIPVIDFHTRPESEILCIVHEGKWADWKNTSLKPSEYCRTELGFGSVKSERFLRKYWCAPDDLREALIEYERIHDRQGGERGIASLLK